MMFVQVYHSTITESPFCLPQTSFPPSLCHPYPHQPQFISKEASSGSKRSNPALLVPCFQLKDVDHEGWMNKMGGSGFTPKNWRRRWFVLKSGKLYYYKTSFVSDYFYSGTSQILGPLRDSPGYNYQSCSVHYQNLVSHKSVPFVKLSSIEGFRCTIC